MEAVSNWILKKPYLGVFVDGQFMNRQPIIVFVILSSVVTMIFIGLIVGCVCLFDLGRWSKLLVSCVTTFALWCGGAFSLDRF